MHSLPRGGPGGETKNREGLYREYGQLFESNSQNPGGLEKSGAARKGDAKEMSDGLRRIQIPQGTVIKISGLPFWLESETVVLGTKGNLSLLPEAYQGKSLGEPSKLRPAQSSTSDTIKPSSESTKDLK